MSTKFYYVTEKSGYAFFNNALNEVNVLSQRITNDEDGIHIFLTVSNGKDSVEIPHTEFYKTEADALNGKCVTNMTGYCSSFFNVDDDNRYYTIDNGQAVGHDFEWKTIFKKDCKCTSPEFPEDGEIYSDETIARQMVECPVNEINGNKHTAVGIMRRLMLSDEQKEVLKKFEESFKALLKANISICYDYSYDAFYAINDDPNIKIRSEEDGCRDAEKLKEQGYEYVNILHSEVCHKFAVNFSFDTYLNSDVGRGIFAKVNTEESESEK